MYLISSCSSKHLQSLPFSLFPSSRLPHAPTKSQVLHLETYWSNVNVHRNSPFPPPNPPTLLIFCCLCRWHLEVGKVGKKLANTLSWVQWQGCWGGDGWHETEPPPVTFHWEQPQKLPSRACKPVWVGAACLLPVSFLVWRAAVATTPLSCLGLSVLPCVMHKEQEKINHQKLLTPCKPWRCGWSYEDSCKWNSTSYRVWQLSRGAISFCSCDKTRSIGRGYCPPLSAWLPKAPNASVLMGVILKVSGKQLTLFIDPEEEGKYAPISNF